MRSDVLLTLDRAAKANDDSGIVNFGQGDRRSLEMKLTFLRGTSDDGECPALYETDRGTYVVQGAAVTDPEALADLRDVLDGETFVEIPKELLHFSEAE
jgi:hypothetical protein